MILALAGAILGQALDGITFSLMVGRYGMVAEANPLTRSLGVGAALGLKAIFILLLIGFAYRFGEKFPRGTTWGLGVAFAAGVVAALTNLSVLA